ncbi:hypothetical protein ACQPZZ_28865 [Microbispora sp. CA-135349]|uniref:hypothetical protein n=1 Tax=Microbispora sp. CA-135349 TaxID=3239953 RepID=UPI003D8A1003
MKRRVALAVAVLIASVPVGAGPAAAQAGAPDPVRALQRQFRSEHGVRISETDRFFYGGKSKASGNGIRVTGVLQLGRTGPVAARFTWWSIKGTSSGKSDPYRVVRVGKDAYDAADRYPGPVPGGKEWIRFPSRHRGQTGRDLARDASLQPIDVYDPSLMKAVLKRSTSTPVSGGRLYKGTMSRKELGRLAKGTVVDWTSGRPIGAKSKGKITWRLWAGRDGLLKRLVTADTVGQGKDPLVKRSDTRYTGWGCPVVITAPPADEVIDEADLLDYIRSQNTPIPEDSGNT